MRKNIKYSVSFIIIILSLTLGFVVYAEDNTETSDEAVACTMDAKLCPDGSSVGRTGPDCEFAKCPGAVNVNARGEVRVKIEDIRKNIQEKKEENKIKRDDFKVEVKNKVAETQADKEERRVEFEAKIQSVKEKREAFKTEMEGRKEEFKTKTEEMRAKFKEGLTKIKDEKKKISAEKIVDIIASLNIKLTTNLSNQVEKIENVLVSIESRISKAEENDLDVSSVKIEVEKAKTAIALAREAISTQANKVYDITITDEAGLRVEMKKLRDAFSKDIKAVHEKVKLAHEAVRNTATTLAKIPKIDEEVEVEAEVEVSSTTNNN